MPEWHLFVKAIAGANVAVVSRGQRFRSCSWIIFQPLKPVKRHWNKKKLASLLCAIISHGSLQRWKPSETFCWFKTLYMWSKLKDIAGNKSYQNQSNVIHVISEHWHLREGLDINEINIPSMDTCLWSQTVTLHQNTFNNICGFLLFKGNLRSKMNPSPLCMHWLWTWSIYGLSLKKKNTRFALVFRLLYFYFFLRIERDKSQAHVRNTCISHSKEIRPNYHQTIRAINQLNLFKFVLAKSRVALEEVTFWSPSIACTWWCEEGQHDMNTE